MGLTEKNCKTLLYAISTALLCLEQLKVTNLEQVNLIPDLIELEEKFTKLYREKQFNKK